MHTPYRQIALVAAVAGIGCWWLAGCSSGSGAGLDLAGRPVGEGGDVPPAATLESIQANLFDPLCIVCHAGAAAPQGLRLDAANSFAQLVGVPSREVPSQLRVAPGDPDASYLVNKLEGTATVGDRMPLGGPPVPAATVLLVREWIAAGAARGTSGQAPVVLSMSAASGRVTLRFDQPLDAPTVNPATFELLADGGDGGFDDGNERAVMLGMPQISPADARTVVLEVADTAEGERLRLTIRGSGASFVQNVSGTALDGEHFGGPFSGDGQPGGDYVVEFDLAGGAP